MAEGGGAVRVPFGRGAGGAVCAESWRSGSEVGDVGSGVFGVAAAARGAGARSVSWGSAEAGQREGAVGLRAEAGPRGRREAAAMAQAGS